MHIGYWLQSFVKEWVLRTLLKLKSTNFSRSATSRREQHHHSSLWQFPVSTRLMQFFVSLSTCEKNIREFKKIGNRFISFNMKYFNNFKIKMQFIHVKCFFFQILKYFPKVFINLFYIASIYCSTRVRFEISTGIIHSPPDLFKKTLIQRGTVLFFSPTPIQLTFYY